MVNELKDYEQGVETLETLALKGAFDPLVKLQVQSDSLINRSSPSAGIRPFARIAAFDMLGRLSDGKTMDNQVIDFPIDYTPQDFLRVMKRVRGGVNEALLVNLKRGYEMRDQITLKRLEGLYASYKHLKDVEFENEVINQTLEVVADLNIFMEEVDIPALYLGLEVDKKVGFGFRDIDIDREGKLLFAQRVAQALTNGKPLQIVSTICPGYTHTTDGIYDFEGLTEDAGLIGKIHLAYLSQVITLALQRNDVPFDCQMIVADLSEGFDDTVVNKFTGGDREAFLAVARGTVTAARSLAEKLGLMGVNVSTIGSYFDISYDDYKAEREQMINQILKLTDADRSFGHRFEAYLNPRRPLYTKFLASEGSDVDEGILRRRAANGFAQYFHHFDQLRQKAPDAVVLNHLTKSLSFINGGLLEDNGEVKFVNDVGKFGKVKFPILVLEAQTY